MLVTEHHSTDAAQIDGAVNIWATHFQGYNASTAAARRAAGVQQWGYQVDAWGGTYMGWMIDYPILNYRVPLWASWVNRVDGLLYWAMTYWAAIADPWTDTGTYSYSGMITERRGLTLLPGQRRRLPGAHRERPAQGAAGRHGGLRVPEAPRRVSPAPRSADSMARTVATSYSSWNGSAANLQTNRRRSPSGSSPASKAGARAAT